MSPQPDLWLLPDAIFDGTRLREGAALGITQQPGLTVAESVAAALKSLESSQAEIARLRDEADRARCGHAQDMTQGRALREDRHGLSRDGRESCFGEGGIVGVAQAPSMALERGFGKSRSALVPAHDRDRADVLVREAAEVMREAETRQLLALARASLAL